MLFVCKFIPSIALESLKYINKNRIKKIKIKNNMYVVVALEEIKDI